MYHLQSRTLTENHPISYITFYILIPFPLQLNLFLLRTNNLTNHIYNQNPMEKEKPIVIVQKLSQHGSSAKSGQISINVEDPQLNEKDKFTYSVVGVDREGPFSVRRRYSDFDHLRKKLGQRWLGIYIPPISGKRADNNPLYLLKVFDNKVGDEAKYAQTRRRFLKYFCQGVAIRPYLYYCDLFQLFIRGGPDFQTAIATAISKQYNFLLNAYEQSFSSLLINRQSLDMTLLINTNQKSFTVLKQSETLLQSICDKIFRAAQCRQNFNIQFNNTMTKTIPQYQEKCMLNHLGKQRQKLIFTSKPAFSEAIVKFKEINDINPLEQFLEMIMYEIREVKSFIEAIEGRRQAEKRKCQLKERIVEKQAQKSKLQSGSFSFKSVFKSGSRDLQINELTVKTEILKNQLNCIDRMMQAMLLNSNFELQQYRLRRGKEYADMFRKISELQLVELTAYQQLLQIPVIV